MNCATALVSLPLVCEARGGSIRTPEDALKVCKDLAGLAQESFQRIGRTSCVFRRVRETVPYR